MSLAVPKPSETTLTCYVYTKPAAFFSDGFNPTGMTPFFST